ncbi:MAG: short-chain dehydrogenase [Verrucomicrobiaceae bacterium]|nr:short-chain dehydrogenase [Verrucomicrobiaceae bacterium]
MNRLQNKVALITGAGGGIGSACTERFVAEGGIVVAADLFEDRVQKLADKLGDNVFPIQLDIGEEKSFKAAVDATIKRYGRIDILFNNAALTDSATQNADLTVIDTPVEVWSRIMHVNVTGCMFGCRHAIPHMIANGGGSIINTASNGALSGDALRIAYGTSKAAVAAFTKYVATQHGRKHIRCNAIAPGPIITENFKDVSPELSAILHRHSLTENLGKPEDIAALAAFLAADESRYITGQLITIDGGQTTHLAHFADLEDYLEQFAQV